MSSVSANKCCITDLASRVWHRHQRLLFGVCGRLFMQFVLYEIWLRRDNLNIQTVRTSHSAGSFAPPAADTSGTCEVGLQRSCLRCQALQHPSSLLLSRVTLLVRLAAGLKKTVAYITFARRCLRSSSILLA